MRLLLMNCGLFPSAPGGAQWSITHRFHGPGNSCSRLRRQRKPKQLRVCNELMWGLIPAAGVGSRIQPLGFSKELLPVGAQSEENRRPKAVSQYLVDRMLIAGVTKLCFVISPAKTDLLRYYGGRVDGADVCYVIQ